MDHHKSDAPGPYQGLWRDVKGKILRSYNPFGEVEMSRPEAPPLECPRPLRDEILATCLTIPKSCSDDRNNCDIYIIIRLSNQVYTVKRV